MVGEKEFIYKAGLTKRESHEIIFLLVVCGYSSVVERNLAKVDVARSNRVTRF
jgi:hypothetical protein